MTLRRTDILVCLIIVHILEDIEAVIHHGFQGQHTLRRTDQDLTISKVSLTQRGYIQFLRYINQVPPLTEYTFCIWMNSQNLTYNHPLLSYSKHEQKRLIRVWISPYGQHINLEILEEPIFSIPIHLSENHWYHVCQSWATLKGSWSLFLNGKLKASGYEEKLRGAVIEGGGDIVVGQEYTDFDKGLDDGIEGDIYGFNFVLSSTHPFGVANKNNHPVKRFPVSKQFEDKHSDILRQESKISGDQQLHLYQQDQSKLFDRTFSKTYEDIKRITEDTSLQSTEETLPKIVDAPLLSNTQYVNNGEVPDVLHYFTNEPNRESKGLMGLFDGIFNLFHPEKIRIPVYRKLQANTVPFPSRRYSGPSHGLNDVIETPKSLGMLLVELSFNCALRKGAPLKGKGVLINWTDSPVRVFGGAILKNIPVFCI